MVGGVLEGQVEAQSEQEEVADEQEAAGQREFVGETGRVVHWLA
jgi:hypothetical protein